MSAADIELLRQGFVRDKAALLAAWQADAAHARPRSVRWLLHALSDLCDAMLRALWALHGMDAHGAALVAVGGFGRREQFAFSDVDVLIVLPEASCAQASSAVEAFVGACWDAGLEPGMSVRSVAQCVQAAWADVSVQTALLERRFLAGKRSLYVQLTQACATAMRPWRFFLDKTQEMRLRHQKYEHTPYALEPNCKESPGGLRDLHLVLWVARAAGYGQSWAALARCGLLTPYEARQAQRHRAWLGVLRMQLHVLAGRREDRLVFDLQDALAAGMACAGKPHLRARPSEELMRRYYWTAKAVAQLTQVALLNLAERLRADGYAQGQGLPAPSGAAHDTPVSRTATLRADYAAARPEAPARVLQAPHFFERDGLLDIASADLYQRHPHAILQTFVLLQRHAGLRGLSARTLRALYNARAVMDAAFRRDGANRAAFMQILQAPQGVTRALRLMNQTSVLGRYLWVFRRIVGQMQHDLFHVYTVDQHILMTVRNVRRFFTPEHAHEYPLCARLAADWDAPWLLSTAALFHDIAKGRGGDHSALGAREVRRFARAHALARSDADMLVFLVREHLSMSWVAQKQDASDPRVIAAFARSVGDARHLTALYLLTVADIRATSPKVWNAWKARLLENLYHATLRALGGHTPDANALVQARQREALALLGAQPPQALWSRLDAAYFMRHDAEEIAWHARHIAAQDAAGSSAVSARAAPQGEGLQILLYTPDQPALFARICGYFDQAACTILDARIHTTRDGYALDTFTIAHNTPQAALPASAIERGLMRSLQEPAGRSPGAPPAPARASRRARSFPLTPEVQCEPDEHARCWLLSLTASDRPGLLHSVARVLAAHGIDVQLAKISTMGDRVEDSLLIHAPQLRDDKALCALENELLQALR